MPDDGKNDMALNTSDEKKRKERGETGLYMAGQTPNSLAAFELKIQEANNRNELFANIIEYASLPFGIGNPDGSFGFMNRAFEEARRIYQG